MFNKKTKLKLTDFECNLLINGMNAFRNMLLTDGIPTEDVDDLLTFSDVGGKLLSKVLSIRSVRLLPSRRLCSSSEGDTFIFIFSQLHIVTINN